ncbi:MAG TPA: hypothetical protein VF553_03935 [Pyrinomonadaceae bacterium]|jgi:hypothetical protein
MAIWFKIAIALNIVYWGIFFFLLSRRRWNVAALAVGIFHMLFAVAFSVAPIRSALDPDYIGLSIGLISFTGWAVPLPAALLLGWALFAAWLAVGKGRGRWMTLIAVGDILFSISLGASILLDSSNWKFQLGEHLTIDGYTGAVVVLTLFTLPFVLSALWAIRRARLDGNSPTPGQIAEDRRADSEDHGEGRDGGLHFSKSYA